MYHFQHIARTGSACLLAAALYACTPEKSSRDLGALPTASFTATPLADNPNRIVIASTTPGAFIWNWDWDGNPNTPKPASLKEKDTVTFLKKGDYTIQLTAYTEGGAGVATQKITVANDLLPVNQLKGSSMEDGDAQYWTPLITGGNPTGVSIADGVMHFSTNGDSNGGVYQAVQVKGGKNYYFDAHIKGGPANNTWFEIYLGTRAPVSGSDYTATSGIKFTALNTWAGCGTNAFNQSLVTLGCDGDYKGAAGKIKFDTDQTIYVVIKAGSAGGTMGPGGIDLDDVSFSEEQ